MDLIERQAACQKMTALYEEDCKSYGVSIPECFDSRRAIEALKQLPSAEPKIIYCKDCKHFYRDDIEEHTPYGFCNTYFHAFCDKHWDKEQGEYIDVNTDDFCAWAERRTDE